MKIFTLLLALFLIAFEAIPEGLADRGKKALAGAIEFIYTTVITIALFAYISAIQPLICTATPLWVLIIGYVFVRFPLFDPIRNIAADVHWLYIGRTKLSDRALRWIIEKYRVHISLVLTVKFMFLCVGVTLLTKTF